MKKKELLKQLDELTRLRNELFDLVAGAGAGKVQVNPAKGKWSALQILHHMHQVEQGTLRYIQKKLSFSKGGLPNATLLSSLKVVLLRLVLRSPLKFKAPPGLGDVPADPSFEQIQESWKRTHDEFRTLISGLEENKLSWQLFKHPFIGRLNMKDTLRFMKSHFTHHARQIRLLVS